MTTKMDRNSNNNRTFIKFPSNLNNNQNIRPVQAPFSLSGEYPNKRAVFEKPAQKKPIATTLSLETICKSVSNEE
jgi:hypothetical protein